MGSMLPAVDRVVGLDERQQLGNVRHRDHDGACREPSDEGLSCTAVLGAIVGDQVVDAGCSECLGPVDEPLAHLTVIGGTHRSQSIDTSPKFPSSLWITTPSV